MNLDIEEFWVLSTSALVLRDAFDTAGDLDFAVTAKGLEQILKRDDVKRKENGWYMVGDKAECVLDTKEDWKIERVGKYNVESLDKYYMFLKTSTREKDVIKRKIVENLLEQRKNNK